MKLESITFLIVGLGGFIGAAARYGISEFMYTEKFPYGTLVVNILGSFILGFILFHQISTGAMSEQWRLFLCVGILGAFTTMSAFSAETFTMLESSESAKAFLNILVNVMGSITAVFAGRALAMSSYFTTT
jgi:CrcB protein